MSHNVAQPGDAIAQIETDHDRLIIRSDFPGFTPEALFDYWIDPQLLQQWWVPEPRLEPHVGGGYDFAWPQPGWHLRGRYTAFEPGRQLAFTWKWDHEPALPERSVALAFEPLPGGARLTLTHGFYAPSPTDQADRTSHLEGWTHFLAQLQRLAPTPPQARRLERWRQTAVTRIAGPEEAVQVIGQLGIATLFPVSPEFPNLFHAYMGDPEARTASEWDSPAGEVYGWRWALGRREAAFYSAIVRNRPTWVSWALLPAVIRLRGELRTPDELYRAGELSSDARRIAQALEESGGVLSTSELRRLAGFPTGKSQRAAYLKAVEELDTRLLLAKVFAADDEDMRHALVALRYPDHVAAAESMTRAVALDQFLETYLPHAVYAVPAALAKHFKLPEAELRDGLEQRVAAGLVERTTISGVKGICYIVQ